MRLMVFRFPDRRVLLALPGLLLPGLLGLAGCASVTKQVDDKMSYSQISLQAGDLEQDGIGFLTPSAATGREADKQALALAFSTTLEAMKPNVRVLPLPTVLSEVNAAELDQDYKQMFRDYLETGILDGGLLKRIGEITGVRYFAQLNLASFDQANRGRLGIFGLRLVDTKQANMRVFVQIWDSQKGSVAWEGGGELNYAFDTMSERPVMFELVAETAAREIFQELPRSDVPEHTP